MECKEHNQIQSFGTLKLWKLDDEIRSCFVTCLSCSEERKIISIMRLVNTMKEMKMTNFGALYYLNSFYSDDLEMIRCLNKSKVEKCFKEIEWTIARTIRG